MYKHKCAYCNKEYETDTYYSKYCSDTCCKNMEEQRKQEYAKTKTRICKFCSKKFMPKKYANGNYSHAIYCSDLCMKLGSSSNVKQIDDFIYEITTKKTKYFYNTKTKENYKYCAYCNKKFILEPGNLQSDIKYCCDSCSYKGYMRDFEKTKTRICKFCGKEFQVPRINNGHFSETMFCSENCRYYGKSKSQNAAQKQREQTCMQKYNVIYPCLTKQCRNANHSIISNINQNFAKLLNKNNIDYEEEYIIEKFAYDFKIDNILIELNPTYTHSILGNHFDNRSTKPEFKEYHLKKTQTAVENGYRCINVWDWDNWESIINLIKPKQKLYARKLQLKEITKQEANSFLIKYHTQSKCKGNSVNLGLYQDTKLIQVMTFGKPRYNKNYEWELLRLCTHSDYAVVGGTEKLFKHFIKTRNPESVLSYCDYSKFTGNVYLKLGFKIKTKNKPQKIWSKGTIHITDNLLRQRGFDQLFNTNYGKGTNNEQLMLDQNWRPIYDCGQGTYIWLKDE